MLDAYYEMMGWDENGVPRAATFYDHHLEWVQGAHSISRQASGS